MWIKQFFFLVGRTLNMVMIREAFGDEAMSQARVFKRQEHFQSGLEAIEVDVHFVVNFQNWCKGHESAGSVTIWSSLRCPFIAEKCSKIKDAVHHSKVDLQHLDCVSRECRPSLSALLVRELLTKRSVVTRPQSHYSPNLAPRYFFLFPRIEQNLKRNDFETLDGMKTASIQCLKGVPYLPSRATSKSGRNYQKCVDALGIYFERMLSDFMFFGNKLSKTKMFSIL